MAREPWPGSDDETGRALRSHDWAATGLGPLADWAPSLRAAVDLTLALHRPAVLLWGEARVAIPNAAFVVSDGALASGASLGRSWPAGWPDRARVEASAHDGAALTDGGWTFAPLRDEAGAVAGLLALSSAGARTDAVVAELQHQARNAVAAVRSIAKRTAATSRDLDDYTMHLDGRIDALSRAHAAAALDPAGVDLTELVASELLAAAAHEDEAVTIAGPEVALSPRAAEALALALHELATNAIKFGALSVPDGRIAVRWTLAGGRLILEWAESGVPGTLARERSGFGTEVLEGMLPYELGATATLDFAAGGARCTISVPLAAIAGARFRGAPG